MDRQVHLEEAHGAAFSAHRGRVRLVDSAAVLCDQNTAPGRVGVLDVEHDPAQAPRHDIPSHVHPGPLRVTSLVRVLVVGVATALRGAPH